MVLAIYTRMQASREECAHAARCQPILYPVLVSLPPTTEPNGLPHNEDGTLDFMGGGRCSVWYDIRTHEEIPRGWLGFTDIVAGNLPT